MLASRLPLQAKIMVQRALAWVVASSVFYPEETATMAACYAVLEKDNSEQTQIEDRVQYVNT